MIKFVRNGYQQSYSDYWRLVELGEFEIVDLPDANFNDIDTIYITTFLDGNLKDALMQPTRARVILWQLEWEQVRPKFEGINEVWVSDRHYANQIGARFIPFGSHPDLIPIKNAPDEDAYDLCSLWFIQHGSRRWSVDQKLRGMNYNLAPNGWGDERAEILRNSRFMLHVHQRDDFRCIAPQRFAIAASAKIPLVSERMWDAYPLSSGEHYAELHDCHDAWRLANLKVLAQEADPEALYELLCEQYRFDKVVRGAVRR